MTYTTFEKCGTVQIIVDESNKSEFDSGGNQGEIEFC
jgi:hypothetical protein